jgi:hypothetical protein
MPVRYAPLVPEGMGPRMTGWEELAVGGWLDDGVEGEYGGSAACGGGDGGVMGATYGLSTGLCCIFISSKCPLTAAACLCRRRFRKQKKIKKPTTMTTTGAAPAAAYMGVLFEPLSAP